MLSFHLRNAGVDINYIVKQAILESQLRATKYANSKGQETFLLTSSMRHPRLIIRILFLTKTNKTLENRPERS